MTGSFVLSYNSDYLGHVTSETNGEGVTITYSRSSVGELAGVSSSFQDSNHPRDAAYERAIERAR